MLLDRLERFPEANPELAGRIAQGIQHVFLPDGFRLLLGDHVFPACGKMRCFVAFAFCR